MAEIDFLQGVVCFHRRSMEGSISAPAGSGTPRTQATVHFAGMRMRRRHIITYRKLASSIQYIPASVSLSSKPTINAAHSLQQKLPMKNFPPFSSRDSNPAPATRTRLFRLRFVFGDFKNKGDSAPLFLSFELRAPTLESEKLLIPPQLLLTRSRRPSTGRSDRFPLPIPDKITMTIRGKQQRSYGDDAAAGQYHLRHPRIPTGSTMSKKSDCTPYLSLRAAGQISIRPGPAPPS